MINAKMKRLRKDLIIICCRGKLLGNFTRIMSRDEILTDVEEMIKVEETTNE